MNRPSAALPVRFARLLPGGWRARLFATLIVSLAVLVGDPFSVAAANPPSVQLYYVALPDDDLLTLFDADDEQGGTWPEASSPLRSVTSVSIAETGTLVYYDQWEDGGYDADQANPGANTYSAGGNPDGTQIWGDGILSNGCPPSINNAINPCTLAAHDQLSAGQVIVLDNDVTIGAKYQVYDQFNTVAYSNNNGTQNWLNNWTEVGDDAAAATGDVLITSNQLRFSQTEAADSLTRGVDLSGEYNATLKFTIGGTNLETDGTDDLRVQYSTDGTTYTTLTTFAGASTQTAQVVDLSGISAANTRIRFDSLDALEAGEFYTIDDVEVTWGFNRNPALIYFDGRDKVGVTSPVAMTRAVFPITPGSVMAGAAEVLDSSAYGTFFVAPVGEDTPDTNTSAFEDVRWFVMAQAGGATIDVDANGDGDLVDANDLNDFVMTEGGRKSIDGIQEGGTLTVVSGSPVQVHTMAADVGDTFEFRWDALIPRAQWSDSYYSSVGTTPDGANGNRGCTEVWIYNPSPPGTTNENVRDEFSTVSYGNNNGSKNWSTDWVDGLDGSSGPVGGDIRVTGNRLRIGEDTDAFINRTANLTGATSATLSYAFEDAAGSNTDVVSVQMNDQNPNTWVTVDTIDGDDGTGTRSININSYIAASTSVRFVVTNALEAGEFIYVDNVNIAYTGTFGGSITVNVDRPGGANPDTTVSVPALGTIEWPGTATNLIDDGFHLYTSNGEPFLPIQMVDCTKDTSGTDGRLFDWGAPLVPTDQLTDEVLVGYAPGCSNESFSGICHDPDSTVDGSTPDVTAENSRSVVWVTPLANTTIYVDTNGSGITCPAGTGAEQTQVALALESYRFDDDPSTRNYVHDLFSTQAYNRDDIVDGWDGTGGRTTPSAIVWTSDWTETGETTSASAGAIQVNTTDDALRLQELAATDETGRTVQRTHNTSGNSYARLSFKLESATALDATDRIAVDVSGDGGTNWTTLQTYVGPYTPNTWPPTTQVFNISSYIATNTSVRFRFVDPMETGDYWQIDDVHIDYVNGGDYDMTASRIKTCNGALIAVAYGQNPSLSGTNDEEAQDFGTLVPPFRDIPLVYGAVGDYVWVDEDGDGDQDAGESGIPNAKVTLTGTSTDGTVYNLTTYTDANGGYLFTGLKPSNISGYTVTVDSTTLPAGLAANPTYDENGIGTPHTTVVNLANGQQHSTADFGYNWSSPAETNTPGAGSTGAIGDRVWIDTDGDGAQDPDEVGVYNLTVQLVTAGPDGLFGTGDDVVAATTTTNHNGNYIFDGLATGAYQVVIPTPPAGYVQTGDPDETLDHKTSSPIVLGPGDVFLDADFGYQPSGAAGSIGDLVWLDADRGNDKDAGEPGIPGVTVSLIKDLDGDGTWDAGEPIIATDITDESGIYGFTGLPITDGTGTDDYIVWVNDTNHALDDLSATYDVRDGGSQGNPTTGVFTGLEISAVTNLNGTAVTDADFAYAPAGHDVNEGLIGDTVFLDSNADGLFDPGEGIEGVTVELYDTSTGLLVASTVTNENGQYFFGGLAADTYTVQVIATTLPAAGVGLTNTVDPDAGTANQSNVTIAAGGINLAQDFGYRDTSGSNAIGGTFWEDTDTDGVLDGGEATRFAGVSVTLYEDSNNNGILDGGDAVIGSTVTDSNGDYSFNNLPDSAYFVDVTDQANTLDGYWHSLGDQSQAVDDNSKTDPYRVTVAGGQTVTTIDYGYYRQPAAIGNFVWHDIDADGIQDAGEPGIAGVEVTLTITWPNSGGSTVLKVKTDATGAYSFGNLLLDEDQDGVGAGEPTFTVSVATAPSGYSATLANQGGDDALDSDLATGVTATPVEGTTDNSYDFGYVKTGSIGNTVWFDENGDGIQDAGEAGIPNVTVELWDSTHTTLLGTRVTDAEGQYLFTNVTAGTYQVDVLNSSLPTGLVQTQIPAGGGDFVNHADPFTTVTVTSGGENLTADFGYNWAPSTDTDGNTGTGAIGDHVWIDTDGDGRQDPGESGISGVSVQLITAGPDGLFGTVDDVVAATTATNAAGNYIFDGLAAGAYSVRIPTPPAGYTQTGDPDHFGTTGTNDNQTTTPIVLGPGDVFLNADFGYQPNAGTFGSIGDFVWFDRDADGVQDGGETGIPGVTVALIKDLDGDGVWDTGEPIISTDITDSGGLYLFGGLPVTDGAGSDDYLVWVNDTDNVLGGYDPTFDKDGLAAPATGVISGANIAAVSNLAPAGVTDADFGYTAESHVAGRGLIGDTIFLDSDGDGSFDSGEGVEGVVVQLYDSTGTNLLASTTTDENGNYLFGNLDVSVGGVGYRVVVAATNFAGGAVLQGLSNTVDPDAGTANQSDLTLTTGSPTNLAQDFGYRPAANRGTIGNLVWTDTDADGVKDAGETGISGVTVDLYRDLNGNGRLDVGEPRVGSTTTAADGSYLFSGLPTDDNALGTAGADYIVDVSDRDGVLAGQWHSLGTAGSNDNSQADPYAASISVGSPNNLTADFGYYRQPAAIGNFVWHDIDADGIQDAGEPGIGGVEVTLTITWPAGGGTTTLKTVTDSSGAYSFGNLLLDEDQDGVGAGEPTFSVSVATAPSGYSVTLANQGGDDALDSDLATGVTATPVEGTTDNSYDFGYVKTGSIGNTVWFDENGDGIQDAGEAGIPNVTVELWNSGHTVLLGTRVTDAEGQYLFTNVTAGTYQVDVLNSSLPTGLVQTQIPAGGGDFVNHADPFTTVTVTSGGENLTADFGYNWAPSTDTDGNTGTGAIGDHVWIDTDGDGRQDPGESGISGVSVQLITAGPDGLFGTVDDVVAATTATNAAGNYIFDGLAAGAYSVRIPTPPAGYAQTGDPDHFGTTGTNDNQTTTPIVLGPGDVFLNADFGYQPNAGTFGSIGDFVWFDRDADGVQDGGETGIPGVTVALIKDLDGDGVWDAGEPIISTDITDSAGLYLFGGLPVTDGAGSDDYLVWVNDTDNVLGGYDPTFDKDGLAAPATGVVSGANIAAVSNLAPAGVTDADFGYTAESHVAGRGLIGDTIFLDSDGDGLFDSGEGVEGVVVQLYDSTGTNLLASTTTDENGNYLFGNLDVSVGGVGYRVVVAASNFAGGAVLQGLSNTVDPDAGTANQSDLTLTTGSPTNLAQDFGYRATTNPGSIGNLVWTDTDADGVKDAGETGIAGVTVDLYRDLNGNGRLDEGEPRVGSTTTAADGSYLFSNLSTADNALGTAGADYIVDVSDRDGVLAGQWHSLGTAGSNDNSQADPYAASISVGSPNNLTADFGYYRQPAAIGNFVWHDQDGDGIQDVGEPGIVGVEVTLTINWPAGGGSTVLKVKTDATGAYSFGNLLLDEDQDGVGAGEPTFTVSVATAPGGYSATLANQGGDDALDSDLATGVTATPVEGTTDNSYDFGYVKPGSIGNTVWFDENGDGIQDAGEAGIPNVTVELWNSDHSLFLGSRITDAEGQYLFNDVPAGTYQVDVQNTTLPLGLVQTQIPAGGGDFVNHADPFTTVTVTAGGENLTADFGYNWAPSTDTDGNTGTGAIGDHVWIDTDGDGRQDPGESGISGVSVQLITAGPDGLFGTVDDVVAATTATNAAGNYIFDGLAAGAYSVRIPTPPAGYAQTGDPDHFGTTGNNDNQTTTPIVLGPGDVFLNADFGYQPNAGTFGSIGDFVWFDRDADGVQDGGETGIPGVTVALIKDLDGDGVWDTGEPIISTDITDSGGLYLFGGLPVTDGAGTDDYLVWVNDTDNVLGGYDPTFDKDGLAAPATGVVSGANIAAVSNLAPAGVTDADFGYTAEGHVAGRGLIGDTIFLDRDADNTPDAGEGIEGVVVQLYDSTGTNLLASTTTDENGNYLFGNLDVSVGGVGYRVVVAATNFNSGSVLQGLTNTFDPDAGTANQSDLTLTTGSPTNLAQDFGYRPTANPGSIGNLVWTDTDADGLKDAGETGISGVTVDLYRDLNGNGRLDVGEPRVGSTTTAADGSYLFSNLSTADNALGTAGADYIVDVSDRDGVLAGQWHSLGTAGSNDNSQADPYAASISVGSPNNLTADFGYYLQPGGVGNFAFSDLDADGRQDAGEPGIPGVVVTLVITYPGGATTTLKTTTDLTGFYSFGNLLQDEDYAGDGIGAEPTFALSFSPPAGFAPTVANAVAVPDTVDSDWNGSTAVSAQPVRGGTNTALSNTTDAYASYDAGFVPAGSIGDFVWVDTDRDGIQDSGEPGIPNVELNLYLDDGDGIYEPGAGDVLVSTTITDGDGAYRFDGLGAGSFWVGVDTATVPSGYVAQYDEDDGTTAPDNYTLVNLPAGFDHLTADFGYGPADTGNSSILGDRVWYDADGDGEQDDGEVGIGGVTVRVTPPAGVDIGAGPGNPVDVVTASDGSWLVTGLPAGDYTVAVLSGTLPAGLNTTPTNGAISRVLTVPANTAVLYADFGFNGGTFGSIANTLWLDIDRDGVGPTINGENHGAAGTPDNNEPPIAGVSMSLIQDVNNDGIWDPDGVDNIAGNGDDERIIATDVTDANGQYKFVGVPIVDGTGTDDYLVLVGDRSNLLADMTGTYDPDGAGGGGGANQANSVLGLSRVQNLSGTPVIDQDFGFAPPSGSIGNLIWHDLNNDGRFGVQVIDGKLDINGDGVISTADDGVYAHANVIDGLLDINRNGTIEAGDGYLIDGRPVINGQIDFDGNGTVNASDDGRLSEPKIQGVVMELYHDADGSGTVNAGDILLRTTTTDADGNYLFTGLPTDSVNYLVRPAASNTAPGGVLENMTKTTGTAGLDNNSQASPYAVTLTSGAPTNLTADYGYRAPTAFTLSGTTFLDKNNNGGVVPTIESGTDDTLSYIPVYLYKDLDGDGLLEPGDPLVATTISAADGFYRFTDLPNGNYIVSTTAMQAFPNGFFQTTQQATNAVEPATILNANVTDQDFGFYDNGGSQTTPVTLSSFRAERVGDTVRFTWTTATETGNIGFNLYQLTDAGLRRVNTRLVPSEQVDSLTASAYAFEAKGVEGDRFVIEDVDLRGRTRQHGTFNADVSYGSAEEGAAIDWAAIHAEDERLAEQREVAAAADTAARIAEIVAADDGATTDDVEDASDNGAGADDSAPTADAPMGASELNAAALNAPPLARLSVKTDGMVRVTYEQLLAAGIDLKAVAGGKLALVNRGRPVPVQVTSAGRTFGAGSSIEFYGEAVKGQYTRTNVYDLVLDGGLRQSVGVFKTAKTVNGTPAASYIETLTVDNNRAYGNTSPSDDPWYDIRMLVFGGAGSWSVPVTVDNVAPGTGTLTLKTWGGTDWDGDDDHHLQAAFNGTAIVDERFDGLSVFEPRVDLPSGLLREGANSLGLTLPGDTGFDFDLVNFDRLELQYPRAFVARGGRLSFSAAAPVFRVSKLSSPTVAVYRFAAGAMPVRYDKVAAVRQPDGSYTASFQGSGTMARYEVLSVAPAGPAAVAPGRMPGDVAAAATDYVVIAHPNFIAGIQPLVDYHRGRGLRVKVVDVRDVYDRYSFGIFDPLAIKAYIKDAKAKGVRFALLVGGDTYDYLNYANPGAMSFIPTLYARTDPIVHYAPVDPQFADVDDDGTPDLAIGRFPVRTTAELSSMVAKTLAYAGKTYGRTAVFSADERDPLVDFTADSEAFIGLLPGGWDVQRAHIDQVGVAEARTRLLARLNQGVALTSFVGHSSATAWTFSGLLKSSDAATLTNAGKPTVVTQWGCWNTYFVSPTTNTLGPAFLLSGDRGAAAVLGASTLTEARSEELLGGLVLPRLTVPGATIGEAVLAAKRELAATNPNLADVLLGWTVLGDPALQVER